MAVAAAASAQAKPTLRTEASGIRTLGVCFPAPNQVYSLENVIEPRGDAENYLDYYEKRTIEGPAAITVLRQPTHGVLRLVTEADRGKLFSASSSALAPDAGLYAYLPENGYVGKDRATLLVKRGGIEIKIEYYFQAINGVLGNTGVERHCKGTGPYWKISAARELWAARG
jgi:hypothetical protein